MVFVDEAWGGHLHFHPELPPSARWTAGADICVQSTHKLAGGLQQTGLIHWREARVDSELMEEAYREYVTTSPELPPARERRRRGAHAGRAAASEALGACDRAHARAQGGAARARSRDLDHLDDPAWLGRHGDHVAGCDLVKTTVGARRATTLSGFDGRARRSSSAGS